MRVTQGLWGILPCYGTYVDCCSWHLWSRHVTAFFFAASLSSRFSFLVSIFSFFRQKAFFSGKSSARSISVVLFCLLGFISSDLRADNQYFYDGAGRLIEVVAPDGSSANYQYDSAGNITAIGNVAANAISVVGFSPSSGVAATSVAIYGSGFSPVASQNNVTFNGTAATVTAATANRLIATLPVGATSGPIGVSNSNGSAASASGFVVSAGVAISTFTPTAGAVGTTVTISGSGFDPVLGNNRVLINNTVAVVSTASATQLQVVVPQKAASGRIVVTASRGVAISASDFIVPPGAASVANISSTQHMSVGSSQSITVPGGSNSSLVFIDGGQQSPTLLTLSSFSLSGSSPVTYSLYGPDNVLIATGVLSSTNSMAYLPPMTGSGQYTLQIASTGSGSVSAVLQALTAWPGGSTSVAASAPAGQSAAYTFSGVQGQAMGFGITGLGLTPSSATWVRYLINTPDGRVWQGNFCYVNGNYCASNLVLPQTGNYAVVVQPANGAAATATLWLSADQTGTLAVGSTYPLAITTPGQNAWLSFSGSAGQSLTLDLGSISSSPASPIAVVLKSPDGSVIFYRQVDGSSATIALPLLPVAGTYSIGIEASDKGFAANRRAAIFNAPVFNYVDSVRNAGSSGAAVISMSVLLH